MATKESTVPQVYAAINKVQAALAVTGITKSRRNSQGQGFNFRGIDDVFNVVSPLLAEHGLCILPRMISRQCVERQSKAGGTLHYVTVEAEFDFVCAADGSMHMVRTFGEAMDSGDKATNKAMSAAYKYAALQAFAIPTEADNDADAKTHQVEPTAAPVICLSRDQAAEIRRLLDVSESDESMLLTWVAGKAGHPVNAVEEIPAAAYATVSKSLKAKLKEVPVPAHND